MSTFLLMHLITAGLVTLRFGSWVLSFQYWLPYVSMDLCFSWRKAVIRQLQIKIRFFICLMQSQTLMTESKSLIMLLWFSVLYSLHYLYCCIGWSCHWNEIKYFFCFLIKTVLFGAFLLFLGDLRHKLWPKIELGG